MSRAALDIARRVYFDTNAIIYFIEGSGTAQTKIADVWFALMARGVRIFISEISVAECLHGAFRRESFALEQAYTRLFFEDAEFELWPVGLASLLAAARIGALHRLKLVDAIHFQAATDSGCEVFLTNDHRFRSWPRVPPSPAS